MPKITWIFFVISSFLVTLPVIVAIILAKLNLVTFANHFTKLVDSWDTVAAVSALVIVFTLVYIEIISYNKFQKIIGGFIILLHAVLIFCIVIPDTWYALFLSSVTILFINKENISKDFYKRFSFYVAILSLVLSLVLTFSPTISDKIQIWTTDFSKIKYNFVKPSLSTSLSIDLEELKSGKFFGEGSGRFYMLWRQYKLQEVINSNFWDTDFTSSYSAITTYFGTLGIVGLLGILTIITSIFLSIKRKLKGVEFKELDDENKFYLLSSISIFIFSTFLLFVFGNIVISTIIFVSGSALVLGRTIVWKERKNTGKIFTIFSFILLVIVMSGFIFNLNKVRSISIYNDATNQFKIDNNFKSLENSLVKAVKISNDESSYRQLSAFYVQKAQHILTNTKNTEEAQKEFVAAANNAIKSAQTAVSINKYNYNNYITLGSAHELQSIIDKDASYIHAREAYNNAKRLYKNNPYTSLMLAKLEWSNKNNSTTTMDKIKESLQIKQNYSPAYYLLSQLSVQNNDKVSAEKYALQAIEADETNVEAYLQYGILTLNNKKLPEAELAFLSILKMEPSNLKAIYYLAMTYIASEKYDTAQELINALNVKLPNSEEIKELQKYLNQSENPTTATSVKKKFK